jgi:hypothetical protein
MPSHTHSGDATTGMTLASVREFVSDTAGYPGDEYVDCLIPGENKPLQAPLMGLTAYTKHIDDLPDRRDAKVLQDLADSYQLGDAPIEPTYEDRMRSVARALDILFNNGLKPRTTGFVLLVFPFGSADGRCNYISNGADRHDVAILLRQQAELFEKAR